MQPEGMQLLSLLFSVFVGSLVDTLSSSTAPQSLWLFDFGLIICSIWLALSIFSLWLVFNFGCHSPLLAWPLFATSYLWLVIDFGLLHLALTFLPRLSL